MDFVGVARVLSLPNLAAVGPRLDRVLGRGEVAAAMGLWEAVLDFLLVFKGVGVVFTHALVGGYWVNIGKHTSLVNLTGLNRLAIFRNLIHTANIALEPMAVFAPRCFSHSEPALPEEVAF